MEIVVVYKFFSRMHFIMGFVIARLYFFFFPFIFQLFLCVCVFQLFRGGIDLAYVKARLSCSAVVSEC